MIRILKNIRTLYTCPAGSGQDDPGAIHDAAVVWQGDTIEWVGAARELPEPYRSAAPESTVDAGRCLVLPGLVDCHTHLAFGGWREDEFVERCRGASYLDIARAGGGIARTVRDTRAASLEALVQRAAAVVDRLPSLGVTTIECKSGYGLTLDDELKLLEVYRRLAARGPVRIVATLLAAHVVPGEYRDDREGYVDLVCGQIIPRVADEQLARFNDVFVEEGAFSPAEARRILDAGKTHGLAPKLHADQLSNLHGAALAADVEAASADHLELIDDEGIEALARAGVTAVALPLASAYVRVAPLDAGRLITAGVPVAVATDFNPGSAPSFHLPLAMTLACPMNHMTPAEVLKGATAFAARAIGMQDTVGSIEPGKRADLVLVDADSVEHWLYHFQGAAARRTYVGGRCVYDRSNDPGRGPTPI